MKRFTVSPGSIPSGFRVCGLIEDFTRMPRSAAEAVSSPVADLSRCPTGGRIRFRTDSDILSVSVTLEYGNMNSAADVLADGILCGKICAPREDDAEFSGVVTLAKAGVSECGVKKMRDVTVFFPRTAPVKSISLAVEESSNIEAPVPYKTEAPIVFYGSSITMGAISSSPSRAYTALVAERLGADHINLGFGGNAKGEAAMAEYIASLNMSAFVMDYEHNADTVAYLKETHAPFFRIIRKAKPELPIMIITRPDTDREFFRSCMGRRAALDTFHEALDAGDRHVDFIDGSFLWGDEDRALCTVDGCHPNDLGFSRMADVVAPRLKKLMERRDEDFFGEGIVPVKDESGRWVV